MRSLPRILLIASVALAAGAGLWMPSQAVQAPPSTVQGDADGDGLSANADADADNDGIPDADECTAATIYQQATTSPSLLPPSALGLELGELRDTVTADVSDRFGYPANSGAVIVTVEHARRHSDADVWVTRADFDPTRWTFAGSVGLYTLVNHDINIYSGERKSLTQSDGVPFSLLANVGQGAGTVYPAGPEYAYQAEDFSSDPAAKREWTVVWANADYPHWDFQIHTTKTDIQPVYFVGLYAECDTDMDAIPNRRDTDSDNDGVPDAIEGAGAFTWTGLDTYWRLTGGVGATGVPLVAGDGQNVGSSQLAGSITFPKQPADTLVNVGTQAVFSAEVSARQTTVYLPNRQPDYSDGKGTDDLTAKHQWFVSSDEGTTWAAVTGATTPTLTLDAVTAGMDGNWYKLVTITFSHGTSEESAHAVLRVNTPPTITVTSTTAYTTATAPADPLTFVTGAPDDSGDLKSSVKVTDAGGYQATVPGTYTITYEVEDAGGLTATNTLTVTITGVPAWDVRKTAGAVTGPDADGGYQVTYTVTVDNVGDGPGSYGPLTDTVRFDPGLTPTAISWTGPSSSTGPVPWTGPQQLTASQTLAAGASHTYDVTVAYTYTGSGPVSACTAGTPGTGLHNEVALPPGQETATLSDNAPCAEQPTMPVHVAKYGSHCDVGQPTCPLGGSEFAVFSTDPTSAGATAIPAGITTDAVSGDAVAGSTFTSAGLDIGRTYWLVETKALDGHSLLAAPVQFTVLPTGIVLADAAADTGAVMVGDDPFTLKVVNQQAGTLPQAGGHGPLGFLATGFSLLAAAGVIHRRSVRAD